MKSKSIRILALILAICACLVLASCAKDSDDESGKTIAEKINEKVPKKFTRGTVKGNVYESEFLGLKFTKPSDWVFYTDDEIAQASGTAKDLLEDPEAFEKASEGEIMDMFAATADGTTNVTITFDKGSAFTDLNKSVDASVKLLKDAYAQMGFTAETSAKKEEKLGGSTFTTVEITLDLGNGATMKQYCYFKLQNQYMCSIAFTTTTESKSTLTAMVSAID